MRSQTISVRVPTYFPAEVAQQFLDAISRELSPQMLLLIAESDVQLAELDRGTPLRKPYQLLGRRDLPPEMRRKAARSMLGYRGAIALHNKMKPLGYPNLVKARAAQMRKAAERSRANVSGAIANNEPKESGTVIGSEGCPILP